MIIYSKKIIIYFFQKEQLENLTEEEFKQIVESVRLKKLEEPKSLRAMFAQNWREIKNHEYNFKRRKLAFKK